MVAFVVCLGALAAPAPAPIPSIRLNNGVQMPMVSLGTWQYNVTTAEEIVTLGLSQGFTHIDAAYMYFNQKGVGAALKRVPRSSYFLTTKVPDCGRLGGCADHYKNTTDSLEADLAQLGVEYVDLVLVHWPCPGYYHGANWSSCCNCSGSEGLSERLDTWRALEELRASGEVRAAGVSNFDTDQLEGMRAAAASEGRAANLSVNQVEWHLGYHDEPLLAYCRAAGITLQAYSPLGGPAGSHPSPEVLHSPAVTTAAGAHNVSVYQVALRWSLQRGVPLVTSTSSEAHMEADLSPLYGFSLSDEEMAALDRL